jgi:hypothetical protein
VTGKASVQLTGTSASGYTAAGNSGITLDCGTATNGVINLVGGGDMGVFRSNSSNAYDVGISFGDNSNRILKFTTANAERARIDSSGKVGIGLTNPGYELEVNGTITCQGYLTRAGFAGTAGSNRFNIQWTSSANLWIDTTNLGAIQISSDYRIKKNIQTQTASALDRVMQLRPVTYELTDYNELFKADGIIREGFIAHEVQEVIPSGAEGTKDEENRVQNLRVDAILSVTVKALQELNANLVAQVAALSQRLAALESK